MRPFRPLRPSRRPHQMACCLLLLAGLGVAGSALAASPPSRQAEVAARGPQVMPFDLAATRHVFTATPTGGEQQVLVRQSGDRAQIALIRLHLSALREQFLAGDFSGPAQLHGPDMPGLASLRQAPRGRLSITYHDLPEGAVLRYSSHDPALVDALHRWFRAQLDDHGDDAMEGHAMQHGLHHHHLGMQGRDAAKEVP